MRLRVVIPVLLIGALALLAGLWFVPRTGGPHASPMPPTAATEPAEPAHVATPAPSHPVEVPPAPPAATTNATEEQHEAYVAERCAELEGLATDDKPESLTSILGELTNRDPAIRQAALNAAVQFGSRDAIPKLMEAVEQTDDPDEKVVLLQAIKFLKLPSLTELAEQARTNPVTGKR